MPVFFLRIEITSMTRRLCRGGGVIKDHEKEDGSLRFLRFRKVRQNLEEEKNLSRFFDAGCPTAGAGDRSSNRLYHQRGQSNIVQTGQQFFTKSC